MRYMRLALMILTSTVVMFILMYLNTYASEHLFFSETRMYMAIMMGAAMMVVMLSFMLGMYDNRRLTVLIFVGAALLFILSLWLVRSQATISGVSYMRAMIPHHSIAVMTSERAQIRDARVRKLADEIIEAQRREIAEMRYLIADVASGNNEEGSYEDPPAKTGSIADALANTLISTLDPAPMQEGEAERVLAGNHKCRFNRSENSDPILWVAQNNMTAAMKLNGVLIKLNAVASAQERAMGFSTQGTTVTVRPMVEGSDWRGDADLIFELDQGLRVGYRGFYSCGG